MSEFYILQQLLLAVVLGGVVGYERERSHKMAGIRTHALVAMGATLLTIISLHGFDPLFFEASEELTFRYDPGRIIAYIIVGIGFIGGGTILKQDEKTIGVTTAATLWVVSILGIAVGMGWNYIALAFAIIAYLILTVLWLFERNIGSSAHYSDTIEAIHNGDQHKDESVHIITIRKTKKAPTKRAPTKRTIKKQETIAKAK